MDILDILLHDKFPKKSKLFKKIEFASVRPNPNGSAEPSVNFRRIGSAELFGQFAELPNLKNTSFWRKNTLFTPNLSRFVNWILDLWIHSIKFQFKMGFEFEVHYGSK